MKFGVGAEAADFGPPARARVDQLTGLASLRTTDENPTSLSRTGVADEGGSHRHGSSNLAALKRPGTGSSRTIALVSLTTDTAQALRRRAATPQRLDGVARIVRARKSRAPR
jgi:hypothetical protein